MFTGKISFVTKDGRTYARGTYTERGKQKQVWRKVTGRKAEAKEAVIREIESRLSGRSVDSPRTFKDLADIYVKSVAVPPEFRHGEKVRGLNTWQQVRHIVNELVRFYGNTPLNRMTREQILDYKRHIIDSRVRHIDRDGNDYLAERSLSSVNQHLRILRAVLNFAEAERMIERAPSFKKVIATSAEPPREKYPQPEEFAALLDACDRPHLKLAILLIADSGARPVELWRLKWSDVDFNTRYITYTSHKGTRVRRESVPLTDRAMDAINEMPRANEFVFGGITTLKRPWMRLKRLTGVDVDLYSLRHLFATRIDQMPLSQNQKQKLMRHTSGAMFGRYAKVTPVTVEEVRAMLNADGYLPTHSTHEREGGR